MLMQETDSLDPHNAPCLKRKADLDDRLCGMYDKTEDTQKLPSAGVKKTAIEAEIRICFDMLYAVRTNRNSAVFRKR